MLVCVTRPRGARAFVSMACVLLVVAISSWAGIEEPKGVASSRLFFGNPLTPQWSFSAGADSVIKSVYYSADAAEVFASLAGADDPSAVAAPAQISALDPETGRVRWSFDTGAEVAESFRSVGGVLLAFMGESLDDASATSDDDSQQVWAFSVRDGVELWSADLGASGLTGIGLAGDTLVEFGASSVSAVQAGSGQPGWSVRGPRGCRVVAGASSDQNIGILARCGLELRALSLDPRTGRARWSDTVNDRFGLGASWDTVSVDGPDTVVRDSQGAETLLAADGTPLARLFLAEGDMTDQWVADSAGHLVHLADEPAAPISVTDYTTATGTVIARSSLPGTSAPLPDAVLADGSLYALVTLAKPLPTFGLEVADSVSAHASLFILPTIGTDVTTLAVGPDDLYLNEQGPNDAGAVVALSRSALAVSTRPPQLYGAHWPRACALLSAAQLSSAAGHAYSGYGSVVSGNGVPGASVCRYITTDPGQPGFEVDVMWDGISPKQTTEILEEQVAVVALPWQDTTTSLPGIGDAAIDVQDYLPLDLAAGDTATVYVRVGAILVGVIETGGVSLAPTIARIVAAQTVQEEGA